MVERVRWASEGCTLSLSKKLAPGRDKPASWCSTAGLDPIDVKHERRTRTRLEKARAFTFKQCADDYLNAHAGAWKNAKHKAQWSATLDAYAHPSIGSLPVASIDTAPILKILRPIWQDKPETASRLRGRIERILDWATVQEFRRGDNPARWRGHLDALLPAKTKVRAVRHHPALPFAELPALMAELRKRDSISAKALEFTILTAARTGEAIGARWEELDLPTKTWTIPAERMKAGRSHRVPLSDKALAIIKTLPRDESGFVFLGSRAGSSISNMAMLQLLRGMNGNGLTVHPSPLQLLRLGTRAHWLSKRRDRNGSGPCHQGQVRSCLSARGCDGEATALDDRVGALLCGASNHR